MRVTFRTGRFCHAVGQPVDYADARRFQCVVVGVLMLTAVVAFTMVVLADVDTALDTARWFGWPFTVSMLAAAVVGLALFLTTATGVHTYWFHPAHLPRERQNRAIALAYYACAPLLYAAVALPVLGLGIAWSVAYGADHSVSVSLMVSGGVVVALAVAAWAWVCLRMVSRIAERGVVGPLLFLIAQPLLVLLLLAVFGFGPPLVVLYLWIMGLTW